MDRLDCKIMPYPWGSRDAIASLTGRDAPSAGPEAELWMGAHPVAPATTFRDGTARSLEEIITADPARELGARSLDAFGPRLPFLLKILAAAEPLSLQAHPTSDRARSGFVDEERRGIPRDAAHRNYKDASHKPELLCALGPFSALSGFRRPADALAALDALAIAELEPALRPLRNATDARGLAGTFRALMTMPAPEQRAVVSRAVDRAATLRGDAYALAIRLAELYPGDIGVVSSLLLELVHLSAGEAIYLGAGNLHAYLEGTGVEIMASSDNVLRGGLTKKHVDVDELLAVLDFDAGAPTILRPRPIDAHEGVYDTPAHEFRLSRIEVLGEVVREASGPEILLSLGEAVTANGVALPKGSAAFVPASTGRYTLRGERGMVFRATTNL